MCNVLVGKSIKTSLYWAIKNCGGCPKTLRALITKHYQVLGPQLYKQCVCLFTFIGDSQWVPCVSSPCYRSTHVTTKAILKDPLVIQALEKALRSVNVFKHAESYCRVSVCVCVCVCGVLNIMIVIMTFQCRDTYLLGGVF